MPFSIPGRVAVSEQSESLRERALALARTLAPFMRPHQSYLIRGLLATLVGVILRVVLPWPMRSLLKPWLRDTSHHLHMKVPKWLPAGVDPVLAAGVILLAIMLAMGLADMRKRLAYARFAIAVSRDFRAAAMRAAGESRVHHSSHRAGDMVTRILGDSARIKTGIRGFLIHVTTNLVLLTAVSVVLVRLHWGIGLIFVSAVLLTLGIALVASERIANRTRKIRAKEGRLADAIHHTWLDHAADMDDYERIIKASSGSHDAGITKIQGFAAWSAHVVFGMAMLLGALLAEHEMRVGTLKASTVLVFVVYALMVRTPLVQFARQGVRLGKVLGASDRLVAMLERGRPERERLDLLPPLQTSITVRDVVINGGRAHDREPVFGAASLRILRGERVCVVGPRGSGKTTLLELLAHLRAPDSGQIFWDDLDYAKVSTDAVRERVSYAPAEPSWSKQSLRDVLGLSGEASEYQRSVLEKSGAASIVEGLKSGLNAVCTSHDFSLQERRTLALCRSALRQVDVYLWDDPGQIGLAELVGALNNSATVVVTSAQAAPQLGFGRIVHIDVGRLRSVDSPEVPKEP